MPPWVWKIPGIRDNGGIKASATLRALEKTLDPTMGYVRAWLLPIHSRRSPALNTERIAEN